MKINESQSRFLNATANAQQRMMFSKATKLSPATNHTTSDGKQWNIFVNDTHGHLGFYRIGATLFEEGVTLVRFSVMLYERVGVACLLPFGFVWMGFWV